MQPEPETSYATLIILVLIVFGGTILVFGHDGYARWLPRQQDTPTPVETGCVSAYARIWSNVQLYLDSACTTPQGVAMGGKYDRVLLRFPNGSEEWKTREDVERELYVKAEDPAIAAQQWAPITHF